MMTRQLFLFVILICYTAPAWCMDDEAKKQLEIERQRLIYETKMSASAQNQTRNQRAGRSQYLLSLSVDIKQKSLQGHQDIKQADSE